MDILTTIKFKVKFFRTEKGNEPVREWLKQLTKVEKIVIGSDIMTIQCSWPIGMPLCKHIYKGLWEIRSSLPTGKIARITFCFKGQYMVLLHAFIKKSNK